MDTKTPGVTEKAREVSDTDVAISRQKNRPLPPAEAFAGVYHPHGCNCGCGGLTHMEYGAPEKK